MANIPDTSTTLLRDVAGDSLHARWGEFIARYRPMMAAYLNSHFPGLDADEVVSETLAALVPAMSDYRYDPQEKGRFHNYLTGILRHKALRHCRKAHQDGNLKAGYAAEQALVGRPDRDSAEEDAYRQSLVDIALAQFFADASVAPRTKEIFRRVAVKGEPPEAVARAYRIDRHTVDQLKSRSLEKVRKYVAELEAADA